MSVFQPRAKKTPTIKPQADGTFDLGAVTDFKFRKGRRFELGDREVAVFNDMDKWYAVDAHCYHAGGPLDAGDIEDFDGRTCIQCPMHHFLIDLATGEGLHQAVVSSRRSSCGNFETKGIKQRCHKVEARDGHVFVTLSTEGEVDSDFYSSETYLRMMGKLKISK